MDVYFMLSQITKNISKQISHNIHKQFKEYIPPSSKYEINESNNELAQEMNYFHLLDKKDTLLLTQGLLL